MEKNKACAFQLWIVWLPSTKNRNYAPCVTTGCWWNCHVDKICVALGAAETLQNEIKLFISSVVHQDASIYVLRLVKTIAGEKFGAKNEKKKTCE